MALGWSDKPVAPQEKRHEGRGEGGDHQEQPRCGPPLSRQTELREGLLKTRRAAAWSLSFIGAAPPWQKNQCSLRTHLWMFQMRDGVVKVLNPDHDHLRAFGVIRSTPPAKPSLRVRSSRAPA